jgi:hypothetical protein
MGRIWAQRAVQKQELIVLDEEAATPRRDLVRSASR